MSTFEDYFMQIKCDQYLSVINTVVVNLDNGGKK